MQWSWNRRFIINVSVLKRERESVMMMRKEEEATVGKKKKKIGTQAVNKGAWTAEEDQKLVDYVATHGDKKWNSLAAKAGLNRCGKSCRLRWLNYPRPGLKRGNISEEEEDLIIRLHHLVGNRWSLIAGRLPGRSDNEIKNHWNTHLSRRSLSICDLNKKITAEPAVITPAVDGLGSEEQEFNCCDPYPADVGHCLLYQMPLLSPAGDPWWVDDAQQELLYVLSPANRDGSHAAGGTAGVDDQDYYVAAGYSNLGEDYLADLRFTGCDNFFAL